MKARFEASIVILVATLGLTACSGGDPARPQGYVEGEFMHIASPLGGQLDDLYVERGQNVAAGEPLFALDAEREEALLRQAEEQLRATEAGLADINTGQRDQEREVIAAQLAQAEAARTLAASELARDEAQFGFGAISQRQLEDSRARHAIEQARVRELAGRLEVASLPAREDQIGMQSAQVAAARAARDQAAWELGQKRIAADAAGLVFDTLYREGEWVPAGRPVIRLLPPANVKVRFFVSEAVAAGLRLGDPLTVHCSACDDGVAATVSFIAPEAEYTPPVIYSRETRDKLVFMIEARPAADAVQRLRPGLPVEVALE